MSLLSRLDRGETVKSVVLSLGNHPDEYGARLEELDDVRVKFGYEIQLLGHEPPTSIQSLIRALETIVDEFAPDEIFFPSPDDRHQDHDLAAKAAMVAARRIPNVYLYATPSTLRFSPNHYFVGTPELLERKLQLLSLFVTQQKAYNIPAEIRALAQATGRKAMQYASGTFYAEGFAASTIAFAQAECVHPRRSKRLLQPRSL
jgi:LmbE family N-acetylglucosaminyl deacetylase